MSGLPPPVTALRSTDSPDGRFPPLGRAWTRPPDRMHCRWLPPQRWARYADLLRRLPPQGRAARFHGCLTDAAVDAHVAGLRWPANRLLGAYDDDCLIGAIEIDLFHRDGEIAAEFSITVDPCWQARRIGTRLMDRALGWARNRWIGCIVMTTQLSNRRLCAIGRRFGGELAIDGEHVDLIFRLDPPDFTTLATEAAQRWHEAALRWSPPPGWAGAAVADTAHPNG